MKTYQRGDSTIELIFTIVVVLIMLAVAAVMAAAKCDNQWSRSGLQSDWGIMQGCLVEVRPNTWIPDERVREVDILPKPPVDTKEQKQ